jgi:hypothetical protein
LLGLNVSFAGPMASALSDLVAELLAASGDTRTVVVDPDAGYFGAEIDDSSLTPGPGATLGRTTFVEWLRTAVAPS